MTATEPDNFHQNGDCATKRRKCVSFNKLQQCDTNIQNNRICFLNNNDTANVIMDEPVSISSRGIFTEVIVKVWGMRIVRVVWFCFMICLVTSGNAMQIIGLNFWLRSFPTDKGPWNFTTIAVSSLIFGSFFLILLVSYVLIMRPSLLFLRHLQLWKLLFIIGLFDALNSFMAIYAASFTPEVLQALFASLVPVYSAVFTKLVLEDKRSYCNIFIFLSFTLIISGVLVVTLYQFLSGIKEESKKETFWSFIYFLSVPPSVLMNIFQALYMLGFTQDSTTDDAEVNVSDNCENNEAQQNMLYDCHDVVTVMNNENSREINSVLNTQTISEMPNRKSSESSNFLNMKRKAHSPYFIGGDDTIVKLVMLGVGTNVQFLLVLLASPLDSISWWGGSKSFSDSWNNFFFGFWCVFHVRENAFYCIIYTMGFIFTYIGSAYLNQYSVTLCSMVGQLSSPFTGLLLVLVPSWNLEKGSTPWYLSVLAVVLLFIGSLIYTVWEKKTDTERKFGENILKNKLQTRMLNSYLSANRTEIVLLEED